jgi:formylglycine-generating enzyme required for sulfatase activity
MKFVRIEPGEFLMGTPDAQLKKLAEIWSKSPSVPHVPEALFKPGETQASVYYSLHAQAETAHPVRITKLFELGKYEVTQHQYELVMGTNPSQFKGSDDAPVEQVSWFDAVAFCNELSKREGKKPYYRILGTEVTIAGGNGYRLPTEAEWEFSCRAGSAALFPFGDDPNMLGDYEWYDKHSEEHNYPIGLKKPNVWGIHDMLGNVREWCADRYDKEYYAHSPAADPPGPSQPKERVVRGGSQFSWWDQCRSADRYSLKPDVRRSSVGFRVARGCER